MELRRYLNIVRRHWMIAILGLLAALAVSFYHTSKQAPYYESKVTFVIRPRLLETDQIVRANETLARGTEINSTYAAIARSSLIKTRARDLTDPNVIDGERLRIRSEAVPGTSLVRVTVRGFEPNAVGAFAKSVADVFKQYIDNLNDVYTLAPLDAPVVPSSPAGPDNNLTIIVGSVLGALLGISVAIFAEYIRQPYQTVRSVNIIDPESDAFNREFFEMRFDQELSRVEHSGSIFSLAVVHANLQPLHEASEPDLGFRSLREVRDQLTGILRPEDLLAYLGDSTFAVLFPDLLDVETERLISEWIERDLDSEAGLTFGVSQYGRSHLLEYPA
ncbi:MAG TPA: diguanylate cyclase [Acidimicrobiales bacterium]|nr:diguanylate cyclase [Acidimicrobiales bacterium]